MCWILTIAALRGTLQRMFLSSVHPSGVWMHIQAPPHALILAPAVAEKEGRSHTEKIPPVHTNDCQHNTATVLITGRGKMPQSDILFVLISLLIQSGDVQQPFC